MQDDEFKILLIDDDQEEELLIREAMKQLFSEGSMYAIEHGQKALDHLHSSLACDLPLLILLDINIPRLNGFAVLSAIMSSETIRHIPVYMFSTSNRPEDYTRAVELGAAGYFCKPSTISGYRHLAEELLKLIGVAAAVPAD